MWCDKKKHGRRAPAARHCGRPARRGAGGWSTGTRLDASSCGGAVAWRFAERAPGDHIETAQWVADECRLTARDLGARDRLALRQARAAGARRVVAWLSAKVDSWDELPRDLWSVVARHMPRDRQAALASTALYDAVRGGDGSRRRADGALQRRRRRDPDARARRRPVGRRLVDPADRLGDRVAVAHGACAACSARRATRRCGSRSGTGASTTAGSRRSSGPRPRCAASGRSTCTRRRSTVAGTWWSATCRCCWRACRSPRSPASASSACGAGGRSACGPCWSAAPSSTRSTCAARTLMSRATRAASSSRRRRRRPATSCCHARGCCPTRFIILKQVVPHAGIQQQLQRLGVGHPLAVDIRVFSAESGGSHWRGATRRPAG